MNTTKNESSRERRRRQQTTYHSNGRSESQRQQHDEYDDLRRPLGVGKHSNKRFRAMNRRNAVAIVGCGGAKSQHTIRTDGGVLLPKRVVVLTRLIQSLRIASLRRHFRLDERTKVRRTIVVFYVILFTLLVMAPPSSSHHADRPLSTHGAKKPKDASTNCTKV